MLLQDVFILNNLQVLSEGTGANGRMKIKGTFQRADEANNNKRIYPKKVLENSINALQESVKNRMLVGELDHPDYDIVKLSNASHLITNLYMEGTEVIGEAEILSTPAGQAVRNLISDGVKIGISSRGMGSLKENSDGTKVVNEDFRCLTFDIVADPSTRGAFPGLTESTKIRKIVESTFNTIGKEQVFVQLLKNKLVEGSQGEKRAHRLGTASHKNPMDKEKFDRSERVFRSRKAKGKIPISRGTQGVRRWTHTSNDKFSGKIQNFSSVNKDATHPNHPRNRKKDLGEQTISKVVEGLARTYRQVKAGMKKPEAEPDAEKAIKKQMAKDRFRKVIKGNPNPTRTLSTEATKVTTKHSDPKPVKNNYEKGKDRPKMKIYSTIESVVKEMKINPDSTGSNPNNLGNKIRQRKLDREKELADKSPGIKVSDADRKRVTKKDHTVDYSKIEWPKKRTNEVKWNQGTRDRLAKFYSENPNYIKGSHGSRRNPDGSSDKKGVGGKVVDREGKPQPRAKK